MEMEIGVVGGEEDDVVGEMNDKLYSTPEDALRTAETLGTGERGRYLLAATFGNVHGVYKPGHVKLRPELLKELQQAVGEKVGKEKPFDLVFHGGSGSLLEEIREAIGYGVVKMNVDTDTQYAFTRPIVDHMFKNYDGVLKVDGDVGGEEDLRPAHLHGQGRGVGMAARVVAGLRGPPVGRDLDGQRLNRAVRTRPLGATGLQVTPVGLGLAALGRPAYIDLGRDADLGADRGVEALERRCHEVLDAASTHGRPLPGRGPLLRPGRGVPGLLAGRPRARPGRGDGRLQVGLHLRRRLADGRRDPRGQGPLAGRADPPGGRDAGPCSGDHLDLYQVHSATLDSGVLEDRAVLAELARLRDEGVVIGLSASGPGQADTIRRALEVDRRRGGAVRLRAGDLEPAGAVGRPRPGRGAARPAGG